MPKHPDRPNGTKLISEAPLIAAALKEVAHLRKQFLRFFVEGTFIGDSVLSQPNPAFVRGYQLGNRLLILVLNDTFQSQQLSVHTDIQMGVDFTFASKDLLSQPVVVHSDLALWLPDTRAYKVTSYDSKGKVLETGQGQGRSWFGVTRPLQPLELAVFEIEAQ